MDALKPCPICGGEPEFQHFNIMPNVRGRIICSCGIEIMQGANDTEDDLRIIWNTRAGEGTRWHELFGTPERAARTLESLDEMSCRYCLVRDHCGDSSHMRFDTLESCLLFRSDDALLGWLREGSSE